MRVERRYISLKLGEAHLREDNRALAFLLELSDFLSLSLRLPDVLEGALTKVLNWFGLNAGRIYLFDDTGEYLDLAVCHGVDAGGLERVKISEGFTGKAARTGSFIAQHVADLEDGARAAFLEHKGLKVILCVPLIAMGRVLGVMNLASSREVELDVREMDLLIVIGNQLAIAVNNARLYEALGAKVAELKRQKEAIEYFAYSVSHDLKSPAIAIHGLTRRLKKGYDSRLDEKGRQYCDQILKGAEQVVRLVDRINAYIMAKESALRLENVAMKEVMETIRSEFAEVSSRRGIRWEEPDALPVIVGDRILLLRVFRNLVDNALKYGGEHLSRISIGHREEKDRHVFSVGDDGVALKVREPECLFQLFHREATSMGVEGTGLGLATVKEIAERHQGSVWLEQSTVEGTTFSVAISKHLVKTT
jgi:K+-sensing histidine kinase KdpD